MRWDAPLISGRELIAFRQEAQAKMFALSNEAETISKNRYYAPSSEQRQVGVQLKFIVDQRKSLEYTIQLMKHVSFDFVPDCLAEQNISLAQLQRHAIKLAEAPYEMVTSALWLKAAAPSAGSPTHWPRPTSE